MAGKAYLTCIQNRREQVWTARNMRTGKPKHEAGFTLLEMMIVMTIMLVLVAVAIPAYKATVRGAREAVLKEDLHTMRSAIDSYTADKQKAPQSLDDLVQDGYLREVPVDPMTQ